MPESLVVAVWIPTEIYFVIIETPMAEVTHFKTKISRAG